MTSGQVITTLLFAGSGIVATIAGFVSLIRVRRFVATANRTAGIVVAYKAEDSTSTDDDGRDVKSTAYFPIVEFEDAQGKRQRVELSTGSSPPKYSVGTGVKLLFDRNNPNHAAIESFAELWGLSCILLGMGTVFLFIAIVVWIFNVQVK